MTEVPIPALPAETASEGPQTPLPAESPAERRQALALAAGIALVAHFIWLFPGIMHAGFSNLDVAGIVYNARLLLGGHLPYVASVEPKPPGTFFLFAPLLAVGSLRLVWIFAVLWGTCTSLAVGRLAAKMWGDRVGPLAVILHAAGALVVTEGDINYSFWMTLPFTVAALLAFDSQRPRRRLHWFLVGLASALAFVTKQAAVTLLLVLALSVAHERYVRGRWHATVVPVAFGVLGATVIFAGLALPYALSGHLGALLGGLGFGGGWWVDYAERGASSSGGTLLALWDGIRCIGLNVFVGTGLVVLSAIPLYRWRQGSRRFDYPTAFAIVFALAAFAGIAATLRFYLHHLCQLWPAMVLLALRPAGLPGRLLLRTADRSVFVGAAIALLLGAGGSSLYPLQSGTQVLIAIDTAVEELCNTLQPYLPPGDPVLASAWSAWGVYEHCHRMAPGPVYKDLGTITTANTNTCMHRSAPIRLRLGAASRRYLEDFDASPPSLFLWKPLGQSSEDPVRDWPALSARLANYVRRPISGGLIALIRPDVYQRAMAAVPVAEGPASSP